MPPQREETDVCDNAPPPSSSSGNAVESDAANNTTTGGSYWDAPDAEDSLKGKTLSTLDMIALESNHPEQQKQKKDDYWEATPDKSLQGRTLSTLDMTLMGTPSNNNNNDHDENGSKASSQQSSPSITAEEPEDAAPSYWDDAPIDKSLQGKRLSTLDFSALATNHPDAVQEKQEGYWGDTPKEDAVLKGKTLSTLDMTTLESNHPDEHLKKKDEYWGATPTEEEALKGKTLSTLEMSALEANHPDEKKEQQENYWEAPEEEKLKGKRVSTIDLQTLETVEPPASTTPSIVATEEDAGPSYWDEAPIDESLKGKRLSSIDLETMNKQHAYDKKKKNSSTPYWEWQGVKAIKKTLSKISLSNLRKGSSSDVILDDDDCVHGGTQGGRISASSSQSTLDSTASGGSVKPITQKKHKLRDSWRKSFQRMSTNTLDQLDESTGSAPRLLGKRIFKSSKNPLDWSTGSRNSQGSDGGITF